VLEEAVDLSSDRLLMNELLIRYMRFVVIYFRYYLPYKSNIKICVNYVAVFGIM
jgi:hypothetical protein